MQRYLFTWDFSKRSFSFCYTFLKEFYILLATAGIAIANTNCYCNHDLKAFVLLFLLHVPALPSCPEMQDWMLQHLFMLLSGLEEVCVLEDKRVNREPSCTQMSTEENTFARSQV